jgi:diguanylate cyclase (GGDEF)-like protein
VLFQDRQGSLWIGTDGGGLNRFDEASGQFQRFRHDPGQQASLAHDTVLAITEDRTGNLWVGTNGGGLSRFDRESQAFTHFRHDPEVPGSLSNNRVRAIFEDREGSLWVGTYEGGLNRFDPATSTFQHFVSDADKPDSLSSNRVRSIFQDHDGTLWIATDAGLDEWRPAQQGFVNYSHDSADNSSVSDNRVTSIYQDRGGVLWVGTYNGVNKWNYLSDAFTYFQANGTATRLNNNIVTTVAESSNGELWVGTYGGGLNRINTDTGDVRYYQRPRSDDSRKSGGSADQNHLKDDRVMALHVDHRQKVWVGTRRGGLSMLDPQTGRFTHRMHQPENPDSLSGNSVTSILSDAGVNLWAGTYGNGLNRLDLQTGEFTVFRHDPADPTSISSDRVVAIYRDRRGTLWVGTEDGGLNRFDATNNTFKRYLHNPEDPRTLSSNSAWTILEGSDRSLWIGTNGGGLNRWTPADRDAGRAVFRKYRKAEGLSSDTVQAILEDKAGYLWVSSNRGLVQLDPAKGTVRHYSRNSGLKGSEFNWGAQLRTRSDRLLFGGNTGLVAFYPHEILSNRHQPDIALSAQSRNGPLDTRYSTSPDTSEVELDYRDDLITFEFAGLDYAAPERVRYRYKLEGFDKDWTAQTDFRRATYTNLPAGSYRFSVQASNNQGIWNETGVSMPLRVVSPPWLSAWAYAAYVLLGMGTVFAYIWLQSQKLDREILQRQELEKQVQERTQELAGRNEELLSLNVQLKQHSWTDSLTGLKNRRFLDEFVQNEVALAYRHAREMDLPDGMADSLDIAPALSFMMIDLDGFKAINDNFGHAAGDQALLQVRDILQRCCRKSDTIIRWGGDEFLIIGRKTSNRAAEKVAERVRVGLSEHLYQLGGGKVGRLTASIGFAVYPFSPLKPDLLSWEQVSMLADQCAYIAKDNGRNAWVGAYGNKDTTADDIEQFRHEPDAVVARGSLGLRTSIYEKLALTEQKVSEIT